LADAPPDSVLGGKRGSRGFGVHSRAAND